MTNAIDRFAARLAKLERNVRAASSSPQLGNSSIENGGTIRDRGPDGTTYQFIGRQFDGTNTVTQVNGPNPPAPTTPGASPGFGGMVISWDGMFMDGLFGPMDLLRVDVHVLDGTHTDPLLYAPAGTIMAGAGGSVSVLLEPGTYTAALIAWTTSGKYAVSEESIEVVVTVPTADPPPPSDGDAPTGTPVVTGHPFAVGAVEFQWPAISNEDDLVYDYWASLTTPVDTSGPPTGFVVQPNVRISRLDGIQIPMDGTSTVYIKVVARDLDGAGPMSAEASAIPRAPDVEQIVASFVAALEIEASQIRGEFISADLALLSLLKAGDRLDINGNDSTITIYAADLDSEGNRIPLITLDPDGSEFKGRIIADDISVLNGLILKGQLSQIASDSGITIMAGVASPLFGPSLSSTTKPYDWPALDEWYDERGIDWDSDNGRWLRLLVPRDIAVRAGSCVVERIDASGAYISDVTLANVPGIGEDDFNSICYYDGKYYSMVRDLGTGWYIVHWNSTTGAYMGTSTLAWDDQSQRPGVGRAWVSAGDPPLITARWQVNPDSFITVTPGLYAKFRNIDGSHSSYAAPSTTAPIDDDDPGAGGGRDITWVQRSTPGNTMYVAFGSELRRYLYDAVDNAFEPQASQTLYFTDSTSKGGFAYKGTGSDQAWYSTHNGGSKIQRYSSYVPVTNQKLWVTFANTDGTYITLDSPASNIAIPRGRYVLVDLPDDPMDAKVFAGLGTSLPSDANLDERAEVLAAGRTMLIDPTVAGGAGAPPAANTFPGGLSGWLRTQTGGFELNGDGSGDWPALRDSIMDELALVAPKADSVSITPSAADVSQTQAVTFDVPFPTGTTVIVTTTVATTNAGSIITSHATGATETGFTARLVVHSHAGDPTPSLTARTVNWHAVPKTE